MTLQGELLERRMRGLVDWISSWITARESGFPVTFVRFRDLIADPAAVMGSLLESNGASSFIPRLQQVLRRRKEVPGGSNFRKGDDEAWRAYIPGELHAVMWAWIPEQVRALLDLQP